MCGDMAMTRWMACRDEKMRIRRYVATFVVIAAVILIIELISGDTLASSAVIGALCIAGGGTVGTRYRRRKIERRLARDK
jgi:hypothetical protein